MAFSNRLSTVELQTILCTDVYTDPILIFVYLSSFFRTSTLYGSTWHIFRSAFLRCKNIFEFQKPVLSIQLYFNPQNKSLDLEMTRSLTNSFKKSVGTQQVFIPTMEKIPDGNVEYQIHEARKVSYICFMKLILDTRESFFVSYQTAFLSVFTLSVSKSLHNCLLFPVKSGDAVHPGRRMNAF